MKPLETIIERNGYEYTLVEVDRPKEWGCPQPKFMGIPNMALKCCKKISEKMIPIHLEQRNRINQAGIYQIESLINGKKYIGSSINVSNRILNQHLKALREKNHHNKYLQNHFNKYGEEDFI